MKSKLVDYAALLVFAIGVGVGMGAILPLLYRIDRVVMTVYRYELRKIMDLEKRVASLEARR